MSYTFTRTPITELPVVIELDGEPAWIAWDYAWREFDKLALAQDAKRADWWAKVLVERGVN